MEEFLTEQYLPCSIKELYGYENRKKISFDQNWVRVIPSIEIVPMYHGYRLFTSKGIFFIDKKEFENLIYFQEAKKIDILKKKDIEYLEKFNYYGLLDFSPGKSEIKIFPFSKEIEDKYNGNKEYSWFSFAPGKIEIDITSQCNLSCIHCSRDSQNSIPNTQLSLSEIKTILKNAILTGTKSLNIMGGEPTCSPFLFEICDFAKKLGYGSLNTSSNGWNINEKIAKKLSRYFDKVQLSLHGATQISHDKIVGKKGAFNQIINACKNLKKYGVNVRISCTVMQENYNEIPQIANFVSSIGANNLRFLVLSPLGRGKNLAQWSMEERNKIGNILKNVSQEIYQKNTDLKIEAGGFPSIEEIRTDVTFYGCPAGRDLLYISSDGNVSCCGVIEEYIGNIREQSILDIWHSEKLIKLRSLNEGECSFKGICSGPCRSSLNNPYTIYKCFH